MDRVVVVGASLAGVRAVESLRRLGFAGSISLVGEEKYRPYDRPPLSKQLLLGTWGADQVSLRRKQGYEALALDLRLGAAAVALHDQEREVELSTSERLCYDGLIIATGARVRRLRFPHPATGVYYLRTLDDALSLRAAMTGGASRIVIVGAGFIGLEVASVARQQGLAVTVIERAEVPLSHLIGQEMGQAVREMHEAEGVEFELGVTVAGFEGIEHVQGVQLSDGRSLPAEVVVVGIGVQPCTEWLENSRVRLDEGVVCDARCATHVEGVVAAGDVARFHNSRFGVEQRIEHWTHAVEMAAAASARLLSGPQVPEFAPVPYFWSDQYQVKIQFTGHVAPGDTMTVVEGSPAARKLTAVYERDGALCGALTWNQPARLVRLRQEIADGQTPRS